MRTHYANRLCAALLTCALVLAATGVGQAQDVSEKDMELLNALSRVSRAVVEKVQPAVVYVGTAEKVSVDDSGIGGRALPPELERFFPELDRGREPRKRRDIMRRGLGSGFIISKDGWIVTNDHVVKDADKVYVQLFDDEKTYEVKEIRRDRKSELAVIKIEVDRELPAVSFGDSDALEVGELVMAFGNPLGLANSVSRGIVSAKKRRGVMPGGPDRPDIFYENFIQTDAAINRGNSGGPLVNMRGEVVGVNTLIATPYNIGIGFAIPSNGIAKRVVTDLIKTGEVKRGWLGIQMQPLNPNLREALGVADHGGVLVIKVNKGDPADKAGMKVEDVLLEYDGVKITDANHLQFLVADTPAGKKVDILILRGGEKQTLTVEVGQQSADATVASAKDSETSYETLGIVVDTVDEQTAKALGMKKAGAVFIANVDVDGPAYEAGLRPGMVIVKVNQKPVATVEEFRDAVAETPEDKMILLRVKTSQGEFLTAIRPAQE